MKRFILRHRLILGLLIFYFIFHLIYLTLLPPFNDESIYIDWAWSDTHLPGHLYDSLVDSKQPLTFWLFGIFERFFSDPLYAGRFVSVLFGAGTLMGIYAVAKRMFDKHIAFLSALVFAIVPIFVFYNRQALMEADVACIGIWAFYALLNLIHKPNIQNGRTLGIIWGIGFLIKSSVLLFVASAVALLFFTILKKEKKEFIKPSLVAIISMLVVDSLLFISAYFWETFSTNDRYSLTFGELIRFPFMTWLTHFWGFIDVGFFFVTPLVFLGGIVGLVLMWRKKVPDSATYIAYFTFALFLEIFLARSQNQRYLMPFLPFFVIPSVYLLTFLKHTVLRYIATGIFVAVPFVFSLFLIVSPDSYIMHIATVSAYSNKEYIRGQMSGYGIKEVMQYIKTHSISSQPTLIFFALNSGNPENAVDAFADKDPQLFPFHIDGKFFPDITQFQCMTSQYPAFFVTRYDQRVGLDQFFVLAKSFPNPDGKYSIGVYTVKKNCKGKAVSLSDLYQDAMIHFQQIRAGTATN